VSVTALWGFRDMGDEIDGLDLIRQAIDWKTAQHLNRVERALTTFCREYLPPRYAVIVVHDLLRAQLDRLDEALKRPRGKRRPESPTAVTPSATSASSR
jgi:hypothetical protein